MLGIAIVRRKFLFGDYLNCLASRRQPPAEGSAAACCRTSNRSPSHEPLNLFACVSDFNDGACAFYRKQGYKEIGPMPNFLIPGYAEILLRKTSGPAKTM